MTVTSNDSGASFQPVGGRFGDDYTGIRSAFGNRAYALGNGNGDVASTLDGGRTWSPLDVPSGTTVSDVSFPTPAVGYALDASGGLFRTENAGASWAILDPGVTGDAAAVLATSPTSLAVIGPRGVRRSSNGGSSFSSSRSKAVRGAKLTGADRAGRSIFAWGSRTLARSANGGKTWSKVRRPRGSVDSVDFVDRNHGFLVQGNGRLYTTRNGGRRWRQLTAVGTRVSAVSFGDTRHGFALSAGRLLRTGDGGRTWAPQSVIPASLNGVAATSRGVAFLAGTPGGLFGTTTGGELARSSRLSLKVSKRRLRRAGTVRVSGRLRPASAGSLVTIIARRGTKYTAKRAVVASNGSFSTSFRVRHTSTFVAQWRGDDRLDGDGTSEVRVRVGRR